MKPNTLHVIHAGKGMSAKFHPKCSITKYKVTNISRARDLIFGLGDNIINAKYRNKEGDIFNRDEILHHPDAQPKERQQNTKTSNSITKKSFFDRLIKLISSKKEKKQKQDFVSKPY